MSIPGSGGVRCPTCDGTTGVIDSRWLCSQNAIRRRRRCDRCQHRFTTYEVISGASVTWQVQRNGLDSVQTHEGIPHGHA
jgi:transcriptional regulator NrdR family protein